MKRKTAIFFGKDTIVLSTVSDTELPEAQHRGPEHRLAPDNKNQKMIVSMGTTPDYIRFTCPWCRFNFEFEWKPGTPFKELAEQIRRTISSQAHD